MIKKMALVALLAVALVGCSDSSRRAFVPVAVGAELTVENIESQPVDIYLDLAYVGTVEPFTTTTFVVNPGFYNLSLDVIGDGEAPFGFIDVNLTPDTELFVSITGSLFDVVINILF